MHHFCAVVMFCTTSESVCLGFLSLCFLHPVVHVCFMYVPHMNILDCDYRLLQTCICLYLCVCVKVRPREKEREKREILRYLASLLPLFVWLQAFRLSARGLCSETKHAVISVTSLAAGTQHTPQRDETLWCSLQLFTFWLQQLTRRTTDTLSRLETHNSVIVSSWCFL